LGGEVDGLLGTSALPVAGYARDGFGNMLRREDEVTGNVAWGELFGIVYFDEDAGDVAWGMLTLFMKDY
jgi:hypothetical protein